MAKNLKAKVDSGSPIPTALNTSQTVTITFVLTPPKGTKPTYANFIEVVQTAHDFTLAGAQLPVKLSQEQITAAREGQAVPIEADFQITFPVSILIGLIDALMSQKETYEKVNNLTLGSARLGNDRSP
jgi:hypothetical protein